jgi:hypothetical protein
MQQDPAGRDECSVSKWAVALSGELRRQRVSMLHPEADVLAHQGSATSYAGTELAGQKSHDHWP